MKNANLLIKSKAMPVPSVAELLQPLNVRLSDIAGQRISPNESMRGYNYKNVLIPLDENLIILKPDELLPVMGKMQRLIEDIFGRKIEDYTVNSYDRGQDMPFGDGIQETRGAITNELKYYQAMLEEFIGRAGAGKAAAIENDDDAQPQILQPGIFAAKDLLGFEPVLSVEEVALLLRYLGVMGYVPNLPKYKLGEMAINFGRSKQNVRTAYSKLDSRREAVYRTARVALKSRLQAIIDAIDKELLPPIVNRL